MKTGVCYYPEHWPRDRWDTDARMMRDCGLSVVRIGEFAWSRLEAQPGKLSFDWLEDALDVLHAAGLSVVLGTPTATPPRWLLERHPDMLAWDEHGRPRGFGSRRHYCFSSLAYRDECARIVTLLAERFGEHPGIIAWQTDNEYGCHDTATSYSPNALAGFRRWCKQRYGSVEALNTAWGNVFWSMEYPTFDSIDLPVGAVTETSPAHRLAFWRYTSDQVAAFNQIQCDILRRLSPQRDIMHNFMGNFVEFDHHPVAEQLDVISWDNYPLGFLTRDGYDEQQQQDYLRTGHPDSSAFHNDLYRGMQPQRLWIMELQPGPVNWAPYNPAPLDGMVRLWSWEAIAHGAELVSYFRWRQAPFAQEQMHSGLLLPNGDPDQAYIEAEQLKQERAKLHELTTEADRQYQQAPVALVFDYVGEHMQRIQQPGGQTFDPLAFTQRVYSAVRQWGVDVDILPPNARFEGYELILLPLSTEDNPALVERLKTSSAEVVLFSRTGSKSPEYTIPNDLPIGTFRTLIDVQVTRVESLPPFAQLTATAGGNADLPALCATHWREWVKTSLLPSWQFEDGSGLHYQQGRFHYLNACLDQASLMQFMQQRLDARDITHADLGPGLRTRRLGNLQFAFNYGPETADLSDARWEHFGLREDTSLLLGNRTLAAAGLAAWKVSVSDNH